MTTTLRTMTPTQAAADTPTADVYRLHDVVQRYGRREVLRLPPFAVHRGEVLAVVGPSGAGKSTLLRLLALLETPAQGRVSLHIDGASVDAASASQAQRRRIAMVFQRPVLMSRSVRANVAYGLKLRRESAISARVEDALARVSLGHLAHARPHTLSGGEMQRVSIARALVLEPQVLLLDEPTANLDPQNVRIIEGLIDAQRSQYGSTVVLVTHNIFQARRLADRVALILEGQLVEVAAAERFFTAPRDPRTAEFVSGDLVY